MFGASKTKQVSSAANYIEDVFSTYLYTGTGAARNIVNNIDLSGKGGMVWAKARDSAGLSNYVFDTARGSRNALRTDTTGAQLANQGIGPFNADGFSLVSTFDVNNSGVNFASWTFRKQPKFFDVVTYTGTGAAHTIAHNLGSVPGCIIVKRTDGGAGFGWPTYHKGANGGTTPQNYALYLNSTNAQAASASFWNNTAPTSAVFTVGTDVDTNTNGGTYVAYLFADNAGGFGLTGTDNVISCGSVTTTTGTSTVNLGYEPQYLLMKQSNGIDSWWVIDTMRSWSQTGYSRLFANTSGAESAASGAYIVPTATGFTVDGSIFGSGRTYIYIAIRRGPMKVPTDATKVFSPNVSSATTGTKVTTGFPVDLEIQSYRAGPDNNFVDRLRGISSNSTAAGPYLRSTTTAAETGTNATLGWDNTGFQITAGFSGANTVYYNFGRAPSFFDEVCYTGTGVTQNVSHNLTVAPELLITKNRTTGGINWFIYSSALGNNKVLNFDTSSANTSAATWNSTSPTTSVFTVGADTNANANGDKYVAYLFATCAGVSKVGSYTGNGSTQTINCGFAGGARFVLIKRTDSTGGWYVYDTARGMTTLTDPYLFLNSTAAEAATLGSVTTVTTGFAVNASILAAINTNAASYVFFAVA